MNKEELSQEQQQLDQRREALQEKLNDHNFVRSLPREQETLLRRQVDAMRAYSAILGERVANFYDPVEGQVEGISTDPDGQRQQAAQDHRRDQTSQRSADQDAAPAGRKQAQEQPQPQSKLQQQQKQAPKRMVARRAAPAKASKPAKSPAKAATKNRSRR